MLCADENISFTYSLWVSVLLDVLVVLFSLASPANSSGKPKHFNEPTERRAEDGGKEAAKKCDAIIPVSFVS